MPTQCRPHTAHLAGDDLRKQFVAAIRGRFRPIRGRVRHFASQQDGFGLQTQAQTAHLQDGDDLPDGWPDPPTTVYRFTTDAGKASAFTEWLRRQLRDRLLVPVDDGTIRRLRNARRQDLPQLLRDWDHWTKPYLLGAYRIAWERAGSRLRTAGIATGPTALTNDDQSIEGAFDIGVRPETLKRAYTRTYENLQSIADDAAADTVRETITQGIADGKSARTMADELTKDIRTLQHTRAETLARTETQAAMADSTLDRYEAAGVGAVSHGEWLATNDARTCPICNRLDGREIPLGEMRTGSFTFEPGENEPAHLAGEYALKPPTHPNCRCAIKPVINI